MYRKIIFVLLLSGYISSTAILADTDEAEPPKAPGVDSGENEKTTINTALNHEENEASSPESGEKGVDPRQETTLGTTFGNMRNEESTATRSTPLTEGEKGGRQQIVHPLSEPVIIVIIFGAMAGIIGTILLIGFLVGRLRKKTSFDVQPPNLHEMGVLLSSVKTENPVE